jgi:hypothetical protein
MIFKRLTLEIEEMMPNVIKAKIIVNESEFGKEQDGKHTAERAFDRDYFMSNFDRCVDELAWLMKDYLASRGLIKLK